MPLMLPASYELCSEAPDADTYLALREAGGLRAFARTAAVTGLANTLFAATVKFGGATIGMGRVIGDGGCFFQLVDIVVLAEHRGRGVGKSIVRALVDHIEASADQTAMLSLIADVPANRLYAHFGFNEVGPESVGMARRASRS